jgi:hypothetical protein
VQLFNLGQATRVQRVRYYVDPATSVLYSQNLLRPDLPPVPLASGVINLKAQFGIDTDNDGFWTTGGGQRGRLGRRGADGRRRHKIEQLSSIRRCASASSPQRAVRPGGDGVRPRFQLRGPPCDGAIDITAPARWRCVSRRSFRCATSSGTRNCDARRPSCHRFALAASVAW